MADRYWVGGTGTWDGTAGTKWASTSGGAGGATVPGTGDDVFFDANSGTGTVTVGANVFCRNLNFTGYAGTFAGGANSITVENGSVTLVSGMTYTYTGSFTCTGGGTGTFTSAGKTVGAITINGSGRVLELGDALTSSGFITVSTGTFTTNNFNLTAQAISSGTATARTINLGSSTVTLTNDNGIQAGTNTNLTFNAGTSQIICTTSAVSITAGLGAQQGLNFYNLSFTNTSAGTHSITANCTFNNLSVTAPASAGVRQVAINGNQTINGTLSTTGTAGNRRVWFRSDTYGVRRTLTVNSAPSLTDADFRDIIVNGTAAPISGTRIGNRGACSGITFSAPKTVYWAATSGTQNWSGNFWASSSGGTPNTDNSPLAQDIAIIDNASGASGIIFDYTNLHIPSVNMSSRTSALTISFNNPAIAYGNWTNGSGITLSGTSTLTFSGEGTKTITSAGKTFSCPITIDAYGGTVELADALNTNAASPTAFITITNGTFDTKSYSLSTNRIESSNSNVRAIKFGASSVTLGGGVGFTTSINLNFDAGTSNISCILNNSTINGGGLTYYNVSTTTTTTINQRNTFNNLTVSPPGSAGINTITIGQNQTVNGTLTISGATAARRLFIRSDTLGTTRTIVANAISANDCDFRDITIAGTAAGSSPTRAGDCGGNSGITFPAPKTVYWNLAGTQDWSATGWATSSGGTPAVNNFPLAQDTAVFDNAGSAGTVTFNASWNVGTLNASARTSAITLSVTSDHSVYGNYTLGSGVTFANFGIIIFAGRGTQTITSAGVTFQSPITVDSATGIVQLGDALTIGGNSVLALTTGTFDAVSYSVTASGFSSNNLNVRTLRMGSGLWTLTGTGSAWQIGTSTNMTFLKGTADILLSSNSTAARTFSGGGLSYNKLTIGGTTSTSSTTINQNNQFTELASTKTVAHTISLGTTTQTIGAWTITGTAGNVVTLTGTGTSHVLAGSATSGIDYLAMGSIGFAANSPAEFYAGANSTGTAGAPVFRTATPASRTLYWVGGNGGWNDTARWSLSSGGTGGEAVPRSMDDVIFNSASNATAYAATITTGTGGNRCNSLTISGPASGNLTLAGTAELIIHGNVTLPATGLTRTYTGAITLSGSTTGKTFTTNGVTLASDITVDGVGCGWTLGSSLNVSGLNVLRVTNGSFDTGNFNLTTNQFSSNNTNSRTVNLGSSTVTLSASITSTIFAPTVTNLTLNAGTSQINLSGDNSGINVGNGLTFNNVSFTSTSLGTPSISGANTFNDLTVVGRTSAGISVLSILANQTVNGTLTLSAGTNATMRTFVRSDTIGITRTLTCNAVSATDVDFRDITIAGSAAPVSGTRLGDCKGNSGITFPAPKTVYWNDTAKFTWSDDAWAASVGGGSSRIYFPLAQDTAVFTTRPNSGATITINAAYNIGSIDMSARTSNTMTLDTSTNFPVIYGNWINGTGTTLSGNGPLIFSGRGSQNITSAGKTFTQGITVTSPNGSVTLQDALNTSRSNVSAVNISAGTFNANGFNVTLSGASSSFSSAGTDFRTINLGSGTLLIAGSAGMTITGSNLTVTGTGIISLTSSSAKTFDGNSLNYSGITLNQGGTGTLTITGNNTFASITDTAVGATTIALGSTTQRVGAFTVTGTAGNVVTITGNTSNLIYTGSGSVTGLDYLNIQGRAYGPNGELTGIWNAGTNSVNSGSLGWDFTAAPVASNANFFLLFA